MKPRLLDLFCGAGGACRGYQEAGFYVVGVDIKPQPHYVGDEFYQADALEFCAARGTEYDVIHASPPCQFASELTPVAFRGRHLNLIPQTRIALAATGQPYIIENVENGRRHLINPVMLCGSMFGLKVWRHRYFELSFPPRLVPPCDHSGVPVLISGTRRRDNDRYEFSAQACREASGLNWMTRAEMDQAIPPAYTRYIGGWLWSDVWPDRA